MSQLIAAATGAGVAVAVGMTAVARAVRPHGRHRAPRHTAGPGRPGPAEDRPTLPLHLHPDGTVRASRHQPTTSTTTGDNS